MLGRVALVAVSTGLCSVTLSPASMGGGFVVRADEPSVFVCYSTQSEPAVMPLSTALAVSERPARQAAEVARQAGAYWQPFAVASTVPAEFRSAPQLGGFYLTCDPFVFVATGGAVGGSGEQYDAAAATAYETSGSEALGIYPIAGGPVFGHTVPAPIF
jgi:hypothetical protein